MTKALIVLGMHRSGTSALMGTLNLLGIEVGDNLMPAAEDNKKGYFENLEMVDINEEILSFLNASWDKPTIIFEDLLNSSQLDFAREKIEKFLKKFQGKKLIGFKDPRLSILLPLWIEEMKKLNIAPIFCLPQRHPVEVYRSLEKRNGFSKEKSMFLWLFYSWASEKYSRSCARIITCYEELLNNPEQLLIRIERILGIKLPLWQGKSEDLSAFLEKGLKHNNVKECNPVGIIEKKAIDFYNAMVKLSDSEEDNSIELISIEKEIEAYIKEVYFPFLPTPKTRKSTLYVDTGNDFSGKEKVQVDSNFYNKKFKITYQIGDFKGIQFVRFDPVEGDFVKVKIDKVLARNSKNEKKIIDTKLISSNGILNEENYFEFETLDPQIIFPVPEEIEEIEISGSWEIIPLSEVISKKDSQIESMKKSLAWKIGKSITWLPRKLSNLKWSFKRGRN